MAIIKPNNNTLSAITALPAAIATGKVLQVVTASDSTTRSTTSTSFVTASNTMSVDITPSATSSKIYLNVTGNAYVTTNSAYFVGTIFRDSTDLGASSNKGLGNLYKNPLSRVDWSDRTLGERQDNVGRCLDWPARTSNRDAKIQRASAAGTPVGVAQSGGLLASASLFG